MNTTNPTTKIFASKFTPSLFSHENPFTIILSTVFSSVIWLLLKYLACQRLTKILSKIIPNQPAKARIILSSLSKLKIKPISQANATEAIIPAKVPTNEIPPDKPTLIGWKVVISYVLYLKCIPISLLMVSEKLTATGANDAKINISFFVKAYTSKHNTAISPLAKTCMAFLPLASLDIGWSFDVRLTTIKNMDRGIKSTMPTENMMIVLSNTAAVVLAIDNHFL